MAFVTLAQVKATLGIPTADTTRDVFLQLATDFANQAVLDVFGLTDTAVASYTDRISVDDDSTPTLMLASWPVVTITSVTENGNVAPTTDYSHTRYGALRMLGRYFAFGVEAVVVVYTAGWSGALPADLVMAALLIAVHNANTAPKAGMRSETIGQYKYELGGATVAGGQDGGGGFGIPPEADRILNHYRRGFTLPN